ncbi:YeiH family protein [Aquibacillus albus]|uniref:Integral membrane protein (TIGR00698 family) n=1 Tax=Aquibacillus albus TaxID=1168171 RepID=A0ABS2MWX9_9BACI|nr:YeiH family protein [Aquibacillus albus]MBM7570401.1 putative integral membrane protein (TIGR00698 family) [Aquibacillus albus]
MDNSAKKDYPSPRQKKNRLICFFQERIGFVRGLILTLVLAGLAGTIANYPFFSVMGVMILSILLGMVWRAIMPIPSDALTGVTFSTKILLRVGIILMGIRLDFNEIIHAGFSLIFVDVLVVIFTISIVILLGHLLAVDKKFSALLAVGTAICGAAAIVAVAPFIRAKKEIIALAVASIAILGTIGTIVYIFSYALFDFDNYFYGIFVGATLHELAHVVAAAEPGGNTSSDIAILVKMGRVALLLPVAMVFGYIFRPKLDAIPGQRISMKQLPIPWFIFGFLGMSLINSIGFLPEQVIRLLIGMSVLFLSMAMAGLGLSVRFSDFKQIGLKGVLVGIIGSVVLGILGSFLLLFV